MYNEIDNLFYCTKGYKMKFYPKMNEHKSWVRVAVALIGFYIILHGFLGRAYYELPIGALIVLCTLYFKRYVISDKGIDNESSLCGIRMHNMWTWDEVTSFQTDYNVARPNVQLSFGKDVVTRVYIVSYDDSQAILELAREKNPDMYIRDMNAEEQERLAEQARKILEKQEAIKAKKKAEKREKRRKNS